MSAFLAGDAWRRPVETLARRRLRTAGNAGRYQKTYGAIGGVMVALLWFYFSGLAILIGAQLDATIERARQ